MCVEDEKVEIRLWKMKHEKQQKKNTFHVKYLFLSISFSFNNHGGAHVNIKNIFYLSCRLDK